MIVVIADDFTGAAEIAGIGLRYNLDIELYISDLAIEDIYNNLFIVCTDSRSLNKKDAGTITTRLAKKIKAISPDHIYKKIDSVFRGHVLDELKIEMKILGLKRALILAANPSLGRTIMDGKYFINKKPINETGFATDPEFSITSSSVLQMVKGDEKEIKILKHTDALPDKGIIIGEAETEEDIAAWAKKVDNGWMLAGAGDFFTALLNRGLKALPKPAIPLELPYLYVSGTAFGESRAFIKNIKQSMGCVAYLPASMLKSGNIDDEEWYSLVLKMLDKHKKAIIAIDGEAVKTLTVSAVSMRNTMAKAVKKVLKYLKIKELFIEGGSTAAAILRELGIDKLIPVNEIARGVVRMKANNLYITVKPGSYELPKQIQKLYSEK